MQSPTDNRITEQQMELLKSLQYLRTDEDITEVRELLNLYFEKKLDAAIDKAEKERNYTQEVYDAWLDKDNTVGA